MKALKDLTGAELICLDVEADYIPGAVPPYKSPPPKVLEENPQLKAFIESVKRIPADTLVKDGRFELAEWQCHIRAYPRAYERLPSGLQDLDNR